MSPREEVRNYNDLDTPRGTRGEPRRVVVFAGRIRSGQGKDGTE